MSLQDTLYSFPKQQVPDSAKTKEWYKKNIQAGVQLIDLDSSFGLRESRKNKMVNYRLANNILTRKEMESIINPFKIKGFEFPDELENFPLINPKIDVLVGESIKRVFNPMVVATNHDAISDKEKMYKNTVLQYLAEKVQKSQLDEETMKKELQKITQKSNWEYQDMRERMADNIIQYHSKYGNWKSIFMRGFEDLLIAGEELYSVNIIAGEPVLERANPLDITTLRMGISHRVEDSDIIIHYRRLPMGKVQDEFYEYLTQEESDRLERGYKTLSGGSSIWSRPQVEARDFKIQASIEDILSTSMDERTAFGGAYDTEGNLKVITIYWKGKRKMGIKTFYNELGELIKLPVTENYEVDPTTGESVKWYWVSEWYEGTRLGHDIYVKCKPFVVNRYGIDNFILKTSPIVGVIANINSSKAMSMYDRAKPYQYLYNAFMHSARKAFRNSRGKMAILDSALIPEGWTMDKYMFYMEEMNIMWENSFNVGTEGVAKGKIAGNLSGRQREVNLEMGNVIQQHMLMLNYLHTMVGEITGVTDQRLGQIESRELVGNVERSVVQSSHVTEKWFTLHDDVRLKAISMFIEVAKEAYRGRKEKRAYLLDDMSEAILDLDGDMLAEADYGVFLENSSESELLMQSIRQITQAALQNDKINMTGVIALLRIKSPSALARKFEEFENQAIEREQQMVQMQQQMQQQQMQQQAAIEQAKLDLEREKIQMDNDTKRYIAELNVSKDSHLATMNSEETKGNLEEDKLELQRLKIIKELELKKEQINETSRHNKETEKISKIKKTSQN